jgi:hypothetical protein
MASVAAHTPPGMQEQPSEVGVTKLQGCCCTRSHLADTGSGALGLPGRSGEADVGSSRVRGEGRERRRQHWRGPRCDPASKQAASEQVLKAIPVVHVLVRKKRQCC